LFFECDVHTLEVTLLFDLVKELDIPKTGYVHFKDGFTGNGRVVVANNSYDERDFLGESFAGRLAEWDGKSNKWNIFKTLKVKAHEYSYFTFPEGYSAQWVRLRVNDRSIVTAQFTYN
jgi:hypothetical protein